ncbi:TIGR03364 family FAD-dependent oxidoreductase [Luteolibacter arcticus]|uniref:TIGR03364 family FAD-dependent oxidoreductase n=1 Tax=Luteolibacter arcticus TaxID=1581411 RepID=A0ABT3GGA0_9BACT|nr:TIGR03364 family FAD-dependent oxidoreductase [Luteolibacter arcticus]MCW1922645.1 TIGR03364 family FAD-dependent oxidoreductase [Luteolibacter arcticus]
MSGKSNRVGIVGGGIVGLANAWAAARAGSQVTVFDRSDKARGASVRNFGMFWPLGQPAELHPVAMRSGELWRELIAATGIHARPCGSVHVVDRDDEAAVLEEFAKLGGDLGYECELWTRATVEERCSGVRRGVTKAGLFSPTEINLDPREVLAALPKFLAAKYGVRFHYSAAVVQARSGVLRTGGGDKYSFDEIFVCSGHDFETLFPEVFAAAPMKPCKLQMLRTVPQPGGWQLGPMLASGLTLRHYANFEICPTLSVVKERIARETPELDRYGIHVMASQDRFGGIVLGDSHEYGSDIEIFDKEEIDSLMLRELHKLYDFPNWTIAERWHGIYAKNTDGAEFRAEPLPGVHIATGMGGSGMTMSFGLADRFFANRELIA